MVAKKGSTNSVLVTIFSVMFLIIIITMIWTVVIPWIMYGVIDTCWAGFVSDTGKLTTGIYQYGYKNMTLDFGSCVTGLFFLNKDKMHELKTVTKEIETQWANRDDGDERTVPLTDMIFGGCDEDQEAFIIAVPWYGDKPDVGGPLMWILGGAALGAWGGGKVPGLSAIRIPKTRIPILSAVGGIYAGFQASEMHERVQNYFADLEEKGKQAKCFSLGKPFEQDRSLYIVPELRKDDQGNYVPGSGFQCVLLFKGDDNYYVRSFDGTCKENYAKLTSELDSIREAESQ
ncbi:MAG: hypothetical protein DRO99_02600 [Candidatus Aenigmatarchaeota archaeon]|nr:MAG: hypothetical protein DRO99_02600 [Candidatus Aenigmarchaeota archaeon]